MLIPLRHDNMEGRRWPVITLGLIALNFLIFLSTHWKIDEQNPERAEVRTHILILAANHPELKLTDDVQEFVTNFKTRAGEKFWNQLTSPYRKLEDGWTPEFAS